MDKSTDALREWAGSHLTWYGQSAFRIRAENGDLFFIDPYRVPAEAGPARLILVTHPHGDHYDRGAVSALSGPDTLVVMPRSSATDGITGLAAGETLRQDALRVTAVAAYNLTRRFHPRSAGWTGYILETDGLRIYHAGDTDLIPEMQSLEADIALLPVGGMFTMNVASAVEAAARIRAALCIPMHYGMLIGGRNAGRRFVEQLGTGALELPRARRTHRAGPGRTE